MTGMKTHLSSRQSARIARITAASAEMGHLIDDLLAFSRAGKTEFHQKAVSIQKLVEKVILGLELTVQGRNIVWKIGDLPLVFGDASMLKQVLDQRQLLRNPQTMEKLQHTVRRTQKTTQFPVSQSRGLDLTTEFTWENARLRSRASRISVENLNGLN
jgi:light-regulated signal transduction histidine kinase (bacteriophytochrome)